MKANHFVRKLLLLLLSALLLCGCFCVPTFAGTTRTQTISEYDMLKSLQSYSAKELKSMGYSQSDIAEIKKPLQGKSKYGKVTYTISYSDMYKKKGETFLKTKMTWSWSKAPKWKLTDVAAVTTSENFTEDSAKGKVTYYLYGNKNDKYKSTSATVKTKRSGRGVYINVDMAKKWDTVAKEYKYIALSGSITTTWSIGKKLKQVGISSNYGHATLDCTPTVSFGKDASISFTPVKKVSYGDEAYEKAKIK